MSGPQGATAGPGAPGAVPRSRLIVGTRRPRPPALGEGRDGWVFALDDDPSLVLKVFRGPKEELSARLYALSEQGQRLSGSAGGSQPAAWPAELILNEDGEVGGYLMRRYGQPAHHRLEALFAPVTRQEYFPRADWKFLAGTARNLAAIVAGLHADPAEFAVGDLSPANIVIDANGYVTLLDTDSMQFTDLRTREMFPATGHTPSYAPPELLTLDFPRSALTDNFSLAVIVLQLLLCGEHPFSGQPADGSEAQLADNIKEARSHLIGDGLVRLPRVALTADVLPPAIRAMAVSAFRDGRLDVRQRPTARQWTAALDEMIAGARRCPAGHSFAADVGECPWCERLAVGLPDPFGKALPADYEPTARARAAIAAAAARTPAPPTVTIPGQPGQPASQVPVASEPSVPARRRSPALAVVLIALAVLVLVLVIIRLAVH